MTATTTDERVRTVSIWRRMLGRPEFGAVVATVIVWVFFAILGIFRDTTFVGMETTVTILNRAAPLGILAVAVALLMIGGEFDLSVGSTIGFSGMAIMLGVLDSAQGGFGWPLWLALVVALVLALAIGFFNGTLVVTTGLPSFIVTLGSLFIFRGLTIAITRLRTGRTQLGDLDQVDGYDFFDFFLSSDLTWLENIHDALGGLRVDILWWVGLTILATWVLLRTTAGNWIFGSGGDANAARNVGVPVTRVKIALFMTTASAAWLVAALQAMRFTGSDTLRGTLQEFNAIIAVVIGGTLLTGGYGSAIGAFFGALIFAMVQQGIVISKFDGDWFRVVVGLVIVAAVIANNYVRQKAAEA